MDSMLNKIEQDCKDGKLDNYSATVGFKVSQQTVNGKVIVGGGHAFQFLKLRVTKFIFAIHGIQLKKLL